MVLPVHAWLSHPLRLELSRIRPRDVIISHTEYAVMAAATHVAATPHARMDPQLQCNGSL